MPTVIAIQASGSVDRTLTLDDIATHAKNRDEILWIDFAGTPTQAQIDLLQKEFALSVRTVAHLTHAHRGPRAVRFLHCRLVVIYDVALDASGGADRADGWRAAFVLLAAGIALGPIALAWSRRRSD